MFYEVRINIFCAHLSSSISLPTHLGIDNVLINCSLINFYLNRLESRVFFLRIHA